MPALFFKPLPFETVWGGTTIKEYYGYDWMPDKTGQAWAFSAQESGSTLCETEPFKGKSLLELWREEPALFGGNTEKPFPVIISMLCPCADLSIQNHPDQARAEKLGLPYGKNEAWYFLQTEEDSEIVFGHNAKDEAELRAMIDDGKWEELLRHLKVRDDDFVYLEAGTLHACCKNVIAYEIQQACELTYRFWDYDRKDDAGNLRELHLEEAIDAIKYGPDQEKLTYSITVEAEGNAVRSCYHDSDAFILDKLVISDGSYTLDGSRYELVSVVRGEGEVDGTPIRVGSHFLAPADEQITISGNLTCLMASAH